MSLRSRALGRLRFFAHWRCAERVVVIESDDWGLMTAPCADVAARYGCPKPWAWEETETEEDIEALYRVLAAHADRAGRPGCLTANFVVGTPDFAEIRRHNASRYADHSIGAAGLPRAGYAEGMRRGFLAPQYHGRSHLRPALWLRDLRDREPLATALFERGIAAGLNLTDHNGWRYHSEYAAWPGGEEDADAVMHDWIRGGIAMFRETFGFEPRTTAAPHYLLPPRAAHALRANGMHAAQAGGYRIILPAPGRKRILSHVIGERGNDGLVYLARTVKFEPCHDHAPWGAETAVKHALSCFRARLPVVIDTHRMNYTGRHRREGLHALDSLLRRLAAERPLFLASVELAEAVADHGTFRDVATGEQRRLAPMCPPQRRLARRAFALANGRILSRADGAARAVEPD